MLELEQNVNNESVSAVSRNNPAPVAVRHAELVTRVSITSIVEVF